ncbi:MAG: AAA family ATPase [Gammaproteobacteria bacterium]|nr:AAA family ATPase [Gammaproteobacteria bacterium]
MYLQLFNLVDFPFQLTPDTDYLYLSNSHARAAAYMDYSVWNQEGFVVITGEVGVGKTLLVHKLLSELTSNVVVAKVFQTQLNEVEFLQAMLVEYGLNPFNAKKVELMDMLNTFLINCYGESKQAVLLVDDAQNLDFKVLEEIRMLSNLEIKNEKILHIILVGQPELARTLEQPELEQLMQRVRLRFHISPLTRAEAKDYILHRLRIAGSGGREIFEEDTFDIIHKYSGGLPRLINTLCDTALTCAFADDNTSVTKEIVSTAISELQWQPYSERKAQLQKQRKEAHKSGIVTGDVSQLSSLLESNTRALAQIGNKFENLDGLVSPLSMIARQLSSIEKLLTALAEKQGITVNSQTVANQNPRATAPKGSSPTSGNDKNKSRIA